MNKTIVALFDDITVARQVVEDLVKADFPRTSINLITNDAQNQYSRYLSKDYTPKSDAVTAGEGAGFGAVVGTLTGILVGLTALMIPGLGLAIVAGPIVGGLTGVVAGALTGGIVGALIKSGVLEDEAPYYAEGIRRGGTLISIQTSDTLRAEDIMARYGTINIHERIHLWRLAGWKGFDAEHELVENQHPNGLPLETSIAAATDSLSSNVPPMTGETPPSIGLVSKREARLDDENSVELSTPSLTDSTSTPATASDTATVKPTTVDKPSEDDMREYEYTNDDYQPIKPIADYPKNSAPDLNS
jgi:hypothetical protein